MRESHQSAASCTPPTGDMPATKVHALDRNRTQDPSVPKPTLYPLSQTSFGCPTTFKEKLMTRWAHDGLLFALSKLAKLWVAARVTMS